MDILINKDNINYHHYVKIYYIFFPHLLANDFYTIAKFKLLFQAIKIYLQLLYQSEPA